MASIYEKRLGSIFVRRIVEGLILEGHIDPRGKSDAELQNEVFEYFDKHIVSNPNVKFRSIIDHTPTILQQARDFANDDKPELSCLFYATWFEHWLNHLIAIGAKRKKLTEQEIIQIIRETQFRGKSTWLLRLLGLKPINESHLKKMNDVTEARNSFVHYKWKAVDVDDPEWGKHSEPVKKSLENIEKTIRYLQQLENKQFFHGKKRRALPGKPKAKTT